MSPDTHRHAPSDVTFTGIRCSCVCGRVWKLVWPARGESMNRRTHGWQVER